MHDREDRITGFATGSFLGCELIYVGFTDFYTLCIFYLKMFCYINIKCLLSLVQTGSHFNILSLQWFVLNETKYYLNENVTTVFI